MSAESAEGERWIDGLEGDDWREVPLWPPIPPERPRQDQDLELVELEDGGVIQTPRGFVYTLEDRFLVELEDVV